MDDTAKRQVSTCFRHSDAFVFSWENKLRIVTRLLTEVGRLSHSQFSGALRPFFMKMKNKVLVHGSLCWRRSPHCSSAFCQLPLASDPYCIGNKNSGSITCSMCYLSDSWLDVQLFPQMEERKKQTKPQYISVMWNFRDRSSRKKCFRKEMLLISSSGSSRKKVRAKAFFQSPTSDEKYFILIPHICFKRQQTKLTV